MTWASNGRATFRFGPTIQTGEAHIIWWRIGDHSILTNPQRHIVTGRKPDPYFDPYAREHLRTAMDRNARQCHIFPALADLSGRL